jgi:hypothetical protein
MDRSKPGKNCRGAFRNVSGETSRFLTVEEFSVTIFGASFGWLDSDSTRNPVISSPRSALLIFQFGMSKSLQE